jgi:hypothetical protein
MSVFIQKVGKWSCWTKRCALTGITAFWSRNIWAISIPSNVDSCFREEGSLHEGVFGSNSKLVVGRKVEAWWLYMNVVFRALMRIILSPSGFDD